MGDIRMTPLERLAETYWNAFRDGYARVGGDPREYPTWAMSNDPVKQETLRCLRHAVETLRPTLGDSQMQVLFPQPLTKRSIRKSANDDAMARKARR